MKKLLIMFLVLGLASLASAANTAVTIEVRESDGTTLFDGRDLMPSDYLTIVVIGNALNPESGNIGLLTADANGTISARGPQIDAPGAVTDNWMGSVVGSTYVSEVFDSDSGNLSFTIDWTYLTWTGYNWSANDQSGNPSATGDWFIYDFHCEGEGDVDIVYYQTGMGMTTMELVQTITQVPEPMTIALLGLGGLFLRRRK